MTITINVLSYFMSKNIVVKSNRLNMALQNLSLTEIRILQLAIIDARETGNGLSTDKPLYISSKRYAEAFECSRQTAYEAILDAEKNLFERRFSFVDADENKVKSRWVQRIKYLEKEATIALILTYDVVVEITRIDGYEQFFTKYLLKQTAKMKSVYSVRMYELLVQWKKAKKTPLINLEVLREQLGIEQNEYKLMSDFKKRVLNVAKNEINEKSDLDIEYYQEKDGKKITGFWFNVITKIEIDEMKDITPNKTEIAKIVNLSKQPSWQTKGLTDNQIKKLKVFTQEFVDANTSQMSSKDRRSYPEIFESWIPLLKSPETVNKFHKIQELLGRVPNSEQVSFNGLKMPKSGKTS